MTTRSQSTQILALFDQLLPVDFDYFATTRTRPHIRKRDWRKYLQENLEFVHCYGPVRSTQREHWQNLYALSAEYLNCCVPSSPVSYPMPEITKVFDSVDKLKADGLNYRIWIARVKVCVRACEATALLTIEANTEAL